jgi:DNA-binding CsgD family transcriptional regulator
MTAETSRVPVITLTRDGAELGSRKRARRSAPPARDAQALLPSMPHGSPEQLRPREVEVLRAIAEGDTAGDIGARLGLSEHTVKTHVRSVLRKLRARNRAHAVAIGYQRGLLGAGADTAGVDASDARLMAELIGLAKLVARTDPVPDLRRRAFLLLSAAKNRALLMRSPDGSDAAMPHRADRAPS